MYERCYSGDFHQSKYIRITRRAQVIILVIFSRKFSNSKASQNVGKCNSGNFRILKYTKFNSTIRVHLILHLSIFSVHWLACQRIDASVNIDWSWTKPESISIIWYISTVGRIFGIWSYEIFHFSTICLFNLCIDIFLSHSLPLPLELSILHLTFLTN